MLKELGIGIRQSNINTSQIREFKIPVPSLDMQKRIVNMLDKIRSYVNELLKLQKQTQEEIDALNTSILNTAFKDNLRREQ